MANLLVLLLRACHVLVAGALEDMIPIPFRPADDRARIERLNFFLPLRSLVRLTEQAHDQAACQCLECRQIG